MDKRELLGYGQDIMNLHGLIQNATYVETIVSVLKTIIQEKEWYQFAIPTSGQIITYVENGMDKKAIQQAFVKFLKTPPLEGLGMDFDKLGKFTAEDDDLKILVGGLVPALRKQGRPTEEDNGDISPFPERGTSRAYRIGRLKRDAPDIAEQVVQDTISAAEGMRRLKARQGKPTVRRAINMTDPQSAMETILIYMDKENIRELIQLLQEAIRQDRENLS